MPIIGPDDLYDIQFDYVCIAFGDVEKGFKTLLNKGIEKNKIFAYSYDHVWKYDENMFQLQNDKYTKDMLNSYLVPEIFDIPEKRSYLCSMNILEETSVIERDYVREQTLALIVKEIRYRQLTGNVAELGVFRGEFSKKINYLFPDKTLYLFDTFEGFSNIDVTNDRELGNEKIHVFKETSEELVLSKMPYQSKCVVKKGYFPDTFDLLEEKFCFVSIDADLYDPIKAGLKVFYERMEKGGYIMVHDYNNFVYKGAMKAVREYCDGQGISYVPIPDVSGSIVIVK